jgi:hypothetical protein
MSTENALRAKRRAGEVTREIERLTPGPLPADTPHHAEYLGKAARLEQANIRLSPGLAPVGQFTRR